MADKAASMQEKKEKESHDKRLNELERNFLQRQKDAKQAFIDGQITSEADFQQQMEMLEIDYLQRRKQVMEEYGEDVTDIQLKIQDKLLAVKRDEESGECG